MIGRDFKLVERYDKFISTERSHVPAILLDNDQPLLFDPGISAFGPLYYRRLLATTEERAGRLVMLLTHSHFDHCGAVPYLRRKFPGARVGASAKAAAVLRKASAIALIKRLNAEYEKEMAAELQGEDVSFSGITVDLPLEENDLVDLGEGNRFRVIETPGHTRDCVSFFFPDSGVLVAGEAAGIPHDGRINSGFLADYEEYRASIGKLLALNARALCIAHAGILAGRENVREYLEQSLQAAEELRSLIACYLEECNHDEEKAISAINNDERYSNRNRMTNSTPFLINLRAKVRLVEKMLRKDPSTSSG